MWYNVSIGKLPSLLLPAMLQRPRFYSLLFVTLKPLRIMYNEWYQYRSRNVYIMAHNGQVCYMEAALNDMFDPANRRIYIDATAGREARNYVYTPAENQPRYLGTIYLRQQSELADSGLDFTVYVPQAIINSSYFELSAQIDLYRLASKRYQILEL